MKTFRLTRSIQIILIAILLVTIAIIIVGKMSNSQTIATDLASECPNCSADKNDKSTNTTVAGDVTGDGKVDFKDIVKINRYRLNKITEL